MKAEDSITLWHFDEDSRANRMFFSNVHIRLERTVRKSGIKEKGFHRRCEAVVRIPGSMDINVSPGDYIAEGNIMSEMPDYSCAVKVTGVCDNRKGMSPHWKLLCGGKNDY